MFKKLLTFLVMLFIAGQAWASTETSAVNQCMATTCSPTFSGATINGECSVSASGTNPNVNFPSITLETTPNAGDLQNDGNNLYFDHAGTENGAIPSMQMMALTSTRTMPSSSAAAIFNIGTSSTGTVAVSSSTTYFFNMMLYISSMSSSSTTGSLTFATSGSIGSIFYQAIANHSLAIDGTPGAATIVSVNAATAEVVIAGATTTTASLQVSGIIRVTTGGTITPEISFSNTSTPVIAANSFFLIYPVATNTTQTVGNIV